MTDKYTDKNTSLTAPGNSRRAFFLHFAISIGGMFAAGFLANFLTASVQTYHRFGLGLPLVIVPTIAYFVCGFTFLRPSAKPLVSIKSFTKFLVVITAFLTIGAIFAVIDGFVRPNPYTDVSFPYSIIPILTVFLWPIGSLSNALAFGLLALPIEIWSLIYDVSVERTPLSNLLLMAGIPLLIAGAFLPSLLMAAGSKLRWVFLSEERRLALTEENPHA